MPARWPRCWSIRPHSSLCSVGQRTRSGSPRPRSWCSPSSSIAAGANCSMSTTSTSGSGRNGACRCSVVASSASSSDRRPTVCSSPSCWRRTRGWPAGRYGCTPAEGGDAAGSVSSIRCGWHRCSRSCPTTSAPGSIAGSGTSPCSSPVCFRTTRRCVVCDLTMRADSCGSAGSVLIASSPARPGLSSCSNGSASAGISWRRVLPASRRPRCR